MRGIAKNLLPEQEYKRGNCTLLWTSSMTVVLLEKEVKRIFMNGMQTAK